MFITALMHSRKTKWELEGLELAPTNPIGPKVEHLANSVKNKATAVYNDAKKTVNNVLNFFSDSKLEGKPERSSQDVSVSLRSKNGGGNNPTTDGASDDNWNIDGFLDGAPGSEKDGNKYDKVKDFVTLIKDINSGIKKSSKATEKVIAEVDKKKPEEKNIDAIYSITTSKGYMNTTYFVSGEKKADSVQAKTGGVKEIQTIVTAPR